MVVLFNFFSFLLALNNFKSLFWHSVRSDEVMLIRSEDPVGDTA